MSSVINRKSSNLVHLIRRAEPNARRRVNLKMKNGMNGMLNGRNLRRYWRKERSATKKQRSVTKKRTREPKNSAKRGRKQHGKNGKQTDRGGKQNVKGMKRNNKKKIETSTSFIPNRLMHMFIRKVTLNQTASYGLKAESCYIHTIIKRKGSEKQKRQRKKQKINKTTRMAKHLFFAPKRTLSLLCDIIK